MDAKQPMDSLEERLARLEQRGRHDGSPSQPVRVQPRRRAPEHDLPERRFTMRFRLGSAGCLIALGVLLVAMAGAARVFFGALMLLARLGKYAILAGAVLILLGLLRRRFGRPGR